jgi:hypothetical protein
MIKRVAIRPIIVSVCILGATLLPGALKGAHAEDSAWAILDVRLGPPAKALPCTPKLVVVPGFRPDFSCNFTAPGGKVYLVGSPSGEIVHIQRVQYISTSKGDASPEMILEKAESYYGRPGKKDLRKLSYRNTEGDELIIDANTCQRSIGGTMTTGVDCSSGPYDATHHISYALSNPVKEKRAEQEANKAAEEQKNGVAQDRLKTQRF